MTQMIRGLPVPTNFVKDFMNREWDQDWDPVSPNRLRLNSSDKHYWRNAILTRFFLCVTVAAFRIMKRTSPENVATFKKLFYVMTSRCHTNSENDGTRPASNAIGSILPEVFDSGDYCFTMFKTIKSMSDMPSRRSIWVCEAGGGFKEYRASSFIQDIVQYLDTLPDQDINILHRLCVDLRMSEVPPYISKQWMQLLHIPVKFQRWVLAVLIIPVDSVLITFEAENFGGANVWNQIRSAADFMEINVGAPFHILSEVGRLSPLHVEFHMHRLYFWLRNSNLHPKALMETMKFFHKYAMKNGRVEFAESVQYQINRYQHAIHLLYVEAIENKRFSRFLEGNSDEALTPFFCFLATIRTLLSTKKLDDFERKHVPLRTDFHAKETMEELYFKLRHVDYLLMVDSIDQIESQKIRDVVMKVAEDRTELSRTFQDYISALPSLNICEGSEDREARLVGSWFKKAVKECINWEEPCIDLKLS